MTRLTDSTDYGFAQANYGPERLWDFFDGDRTSLNIAHECIDRHATDDRRIAVRVAHADGRDEAITFREIAGWSSRFAHWRVITFFSRSKSSFIDEKASTRACTRWRKRAPVR